MNWNLLCDFDGTISLEDVTDSLLLRFGRPGWDRLEADWREGRIGSRECLAGQIALLDCSADELDEHLAGLAIDPDFPAFVAAAERAGYALRIVSDGLDLAIERLLRRHGLGHLPVAANQLRPDGPRRWKLEFPHAAPGCASGTCKCRFATKPGQQVLMIGDGASDFCVAARADLNWARKRLLEHCLDRELPHRPVANFAQALRQLPELQRLRPASSLRPLTVLSQHNKEFPSNE
ncbi:MtnX-like HAD-IB family phosphatase [Roseateles sp. DAIF2]|uniref:MtnX-like HAD-IB family phosphatase n=1 Tax=Roseateles sp. DAIF2 TaxID=2714952 RepID=UPI0018A2AEE1|nr:MtnX-like HAD-IB family phosphatase [Roseateles sp. DAIF2]QPF75599.1 MtnX-like HAD-IB family phosphatase [Roseateles sp. DAIF2]